AAEVGALRIPLQSIIGAKTCCKNDGPAGQAARVTDLDARYRMRRRTRYDAQTSRQAASAIFSSARRSVMTTEPSEIRTSPVRCQLRRHLFTLSRVPPTMFASSR